MGGLLLFSFPVVILGNFLLTVVVGWPTCVVMGQPLCCFLGISGFFGCLATVFLLSPEASVNYRGCGGAPLGAIRADAS